MTRVKICGVTTPADRDAAIAAGANAVGVTVAVGVDTPREIPAERAAALVADTPPLVTTVLVTIPDGPDEAIALHDRVGADAVQVHGLAPDDVAAIAATGATVIAAVDADDPDAAAAYDGSAAALLVDSTRERAAGGTGRTHDWDEARRLRAAVDAPVILAGGLTPDNVADAVRTVEPYAVDVASGVERTGGRKDHDAVRAFVRNATRALEGAAP